MESVRTPEEIVDGLDRWVHLRENDNRLTFLYNLISDTQETIRFIDTKAGFCVTLLTAMMAAGFSSLGPAHHGGTLHMALQGAFAFTTLLTLIVCIRVIFPTVHLQGTFSANGPASPVFFLPHDPRRSRWKAILDNRTNPLGITHDAFSASVLTASDTDLVQSLCDDVIVVSAIRTLKSDRLHVAIVGLSVTIALFFLQLAL
jgi:hypothetical protein